MLIEIGRIDWIVDAEALRRIEQLCAINHAPCRIVQDLRHRENSLGRARKIIPDLAREARDQAEADGNIIDHRGGNAGIRSEEHTSELQSLMRISYAVFCLQKKTNRRKSIPPYQPMTH